jgi:hypothetical protein
VFLLGKQTRNRQYLNVSKFEILSPDDLEIWFSRKPADYGQIIAIRAGLRVLPLSGIVDKNWMVNSRGSPLRAFAISWAAKNIPGKIIEETNSFSPDFVSAKSAFATAADVPPRAANYVATILDVALNSDFYSAAMWQAISDDCDWLDRSNDPSNATRVMSRRSLWLGQPPAWWRQFKLKCDAILRELDENYENWIDWFERRTRGERASFDIPGDKYRIEDKKILFRLAEANDEDFWGKGQGA